LPFVILNLLLGFLKFEILDDDFLSTPDKNFITDIDVPTPPYISQKEAVIAMV